MIPAATVDGQQIYQVFGPGIGLPSPLSMFQAGGALVFGDRSAAGLYLPMICVHSRSAPSYDPVVPVFYVGRGSQCWLPLSAADSRRSLCKGGVRNLSPIQSPVYPFVPPYPANASIKDVGYDSNSPVMECHGALSYRDYTLPEGVTTFCYGKQCVPVSHLPSLLTPPACC
jgi:hypothetical protein